MFKLCTKPTQFTQGKTQDTLSELSKRYMLNATEKEHLIDIIVTNKSLPETEQWKIRTETTFKNFKNIIIDILSSKSNDFNNINSYIQNILNCQTKEELPNILIICYHTKRVCDDLINMFKLFGRKKMIKIDYKFKFHISFDEPDANLGVTKKFIKKIKEFIDDSIIIGILFITATPIEEFWKMLNDSGIKTLLNMNFNNIENFDEELNKYRSFKQHNIIEYNNETTNPLHYIIGAYEDGIINENERKIIFVPGHSYTQKEGVGSHEEIIELFIGKGYCVLVMNSKLKGFIYPDGNRIELKKFNIENNIEGELRESLKKWNELNPTKNLAITGYCVIERGITFNTIGFNFTDMILSNYHASSIAKLIQLAGRASGGKKYVNQMNIITTTNIKDTIIKYNENLEQICSLNPELFNRTDFQSTNSTIPVKMIINDTDVLEKIINLKESSKRGYKNNLHCILKEGIKENKISINDRNNKKKFDINLMTLKDVRMYKDGDKIDARRFKEFNKAYENREKMSQSACENQYNIDFAKDVYINEGFIHNTNIVWITFKY